MDNPLQAHPCVQADKMPALPGRTPGAHFRGNEREHVESTGWSPGRPRERFVDLRPRTGAVTGRPAAGRV